jgi:HEAT repeat protein
MRQTSVAALCALFVALASAPAAGSETSNAEEFRAAAAALAARAADGDEDAIVGLVPLLHAPDSRVRYHAEHGLAVAGAPAVPFLIAEFRRVPDDEGRARVARAIGRIGLAARSALPAMRAALADPNAKSTGMAAYALGAMRAREALPDLIHVYATSRTIPVQRHIGRALASIGSDQSLREARSALVASAVRDLEDRDRNARRAAVEYAKHLYHAARDDDGVGFPTREQLRPLVPGLVRALDDPDVKHALNAIRSLRAAGHVADEAVAALDRMLDDPKTRNEALGALRAIDSNEARAAIARLEARAALEKRVREEYAVHDHQGRTRLLPFRVQGSSRDGVRMEVRFLYSGKVPRRPERVVVSFESTSPAFRFEQLELIEWRADARTISMTDVDRTWSKSKLGVIERISATLPLGDFLTLAHAGAVRATLGPLSFSLAEADRAALRHFAGTIPPPPAARSGP